ncbi:MAG: hypothetical protein WCX31_15425 [Salinivirgaceae bacterium]
MKNNLKSALVAIAFAFVTVLNAQVKEPMDTMPFQLSLITPLGTNGMNSWNTVNNVSLNIFASYAGGVDAFEATGFVSVLRGNLNGAQFSGFANADLGCTDGVQMAGFVNFNKGKLEGAQFAGFVNTVTDNTKAIQVAGFVNTVVGEFEGAQFSGFVNAVTKKTKGAQLTGFVNVVMDSLDGFQGAGFANYSMGNSVGQVSGFVNTNIGDLNGVQAAGFVNVNTGYLKGAQLAGFVNVTKQLRGTQIGFFNYVDSLEKGIPIGIFSIVKNGYRTIEVSSSETLYGITSYKTGTCNFYNIISAGIGMHDHQTLWGFGYGIGTLIGLSDKFELAIEAQSFQINENNEFVDYLNLWNKLTIQPSFQLKPGMEVFGGPTLNAVVSDTKNSEGKPVNSTIAPYTSYTKLYSDGTKLELYPGFTVGMRF